MAQLYERFIKILQKWPVESDRPFRCLGQHIREQGSIAFSKQGQYQGNVEQCERRLASLERLSRNHWMNAYPRSRQSSALGLTAEQCKIVLTDEFQSAHEESYQFFLTRWINKLRKGGN